MNAPSSSPLQPTDGEIVRRVLAGDTEAFAVLVERHQAVLLRFARRMLGDQADAEDVVQESLVRAYRALDQCEDPERVGAWLYAIVVNRSRTRSAQRFRRSRVVVQDPVALAAAVAPGRPDAALEREAIEQALARLEPDARALFLMKFVDGKSYEEIAAQMGMGISALKMRVSRTKDRLRTMLEDLRR